MDFIYKGTAVSGGIGKGKVKVIDCSCPDFEIRRIDDSDKELGRFVRALKSFCDKTRDQIRSVHDTIGQHEAEIMSSHIKMTHDLALQSELISKISKGMCAEQATCEICDMYIERFLSADVEFVRQLSVDVKDVKIGVLNLLLERADADVESFDEDTVVVTDELIPSVVARLDRHHTKAVVTSVGSPDSHVAILLRAMGIPTVTNIEDIHLLLKNGETVIVDGAKGEVLREKHNQCI